MLCHNKSYENAYCKWKRLQGHLAMRIAGSGSSSGAYLSPVDIFVYHDKVIQISYTTTPLFAVLIKSKGMAKSYRELFETIWKTAKTS